MNIMLLYLIFPLCVIIQHNHPSGLQRIRWQIILLPYCFLLPASRVCCQQPANHLLLSQCLMLLKVLLLDYLECMRSAVSLAGPPYLEFVRFSAWSTTQSMAYRRYHFNSLHNNGAFVFHFYLAVWKEGGGFCSLSIPPDSSTVGLGQMSCNWWLGKATQVSRRGENSECVANKRELINLEFLVFYL